MQHNKAVTVIIVALILSGCAGYLLQVKHDPVDTITYTYAGDTSPSVQASQIDDWTEYNPLQNITGWGNKDYVPKSVDAEGRPVANQYILEATVIGYTTNTPIYSTPRILMSGANYIGYGSSVQSGGQTLNAIMVSNDGKYGITIQGPTAQYPHNTSDFSKAVLLDMSDRSIQDVLYIYGGYSQKVTKSDFTSMSSREWVARTTTTFMLYVDEVLDSTSTLSQGVYVTPISSFKMEKLQQGTVLALDNSDKFLHYSTFSISTQYGSITTSGQQTSADITNSVKMYFDSSDYEAFIYDADINKWYPAERNYLNVWKKIDGSRTYSPDDIFVSQTDLDHVKYYTPTTNPAAYADPTKFVEIPAGQTTSWGNGEVNGIISFICTTNVEFDFNGGGRIYFPSTVPYDYVYVTLDLVHKSYTYRGVVSLNMLDENTPTTTGYVLADYVYSLASSGTIPSYVGIVSDTEQEILMVKASEGALATLDIVVNESAKQVQVGNQLIDYGARYYQDTQWTGYFAVNTTPRDQTFNVNIPEGKVVPYGRQVSIPSMYVGSGGITAPLVDIGIADYSIPVTVDIHGLDGSRIFIGDTRYLYDDMQVTQLPEQWVGFLAVNTSTQPINVHVDVPVGADYTGPVDFVLGGKKVCINGEISDLTFVRYREQYYEGELVESANEYSFKISEQDTGKIFEDLLNNKLWWEVGYTRIFETQSYNTDGWYGYQNATDAPRIYTYSDDHWDIREVMERFLFLPRNVLTITDKLTSNSVQFILGLERGEEESVGPAQFSGQINTADLDRVQQYTFDLSSIGYTGFIYAGIDKDVLAFRINGIPEDFETHTKWTQTMYGYIGYSDINETVTSFRHSESHWEVDQSTAVDEYGVLRSSTLWLKDRLSGNNVTINLMEGTTGTIDAMVAQMDYASIFVDNTIVKVDPLGVLWGNPTMYLGYYFKDQMDQNTRLLFNGFVKFGSSITINGEEFEVRGTSIIIPVAELVEDNGQSHWVKGEGYAEYPLKGMAVDFIDGYVYLVFTEYNNVTYPAGGWDEGTPGKFNRSPVVIPNLTPQGITTVGSTVSAIGTWYWQSGIYSINHTTEEKYSLLLDGSFGLSIGGVCILMIGILILGIAVARYGLNWELSYLDWIIFASAIIILLAIGLTF